MKNKNNSYLDKKIPIEQDIDSEVSVVSTDTDWEESIELEKPSTKTPISNELLELQRIAGALTNAVGKDMLATGYYTVIKRTLSEILMLDLAQNAVEAQLRLELHESLFQATDETFQPLRDELTKIKKIKLTRALYHLSSCHRTEDVVSEQIHTLYSNGIDKSPHPSTKDHSKFLEDLESVLKKYTDKFQK